MLSVSLNPKSITISDEYDFLEEPLGDDKTITFSVKAANDAHVK